MTEIEELIQEFDSAIVEEEAKDAKDFRGAPNKRSYLVGRVLTMIFTFDDSAKDNTEADRKKYEEMIGERVIQFDEFDKARKLALKTAKESDKT